MSSIRSRALTVLNLDIFLEVLAILRDSSPRSLLKVALTCRTLHELSQSFIYRTISFTFNRNRRDINRRLIRRLLSEKVLSSKVREVEIFWAPNAKLQPGEGSKQDLELFGQALPGLTGLKTFIWDAQYPILTWLLSILTSSFPTCRLYTRHPLGQDSALTLPRLRGSPCLFSLDVTLQAGQRLACKELETLLQSSPITDLAMDTFFYRSQDRMQPMPVPLRLRSLETYNCLHNSWRPAVSWSMLERLSVDCSSWLAEVAPQLTNLRSFHLKAERRDNMQFLMDFLRTCQRLEVLDLVGDIYNMNKGGRSLWRHLGRTLVKLRFSEEQSDVDGRNEASLSAELQLIAAECPKLRSLGLVLRGDDLWFDRVIKEVTNTFRNMVHFEFQRLPWPQDQSRYSAVTLDYVMKLWTQIWQDIQGPSTAHKSTLPRLRSLDVEGYHKLRITADLAERDDEACRGTADIRCVELEALKFRLHSAGPLWNKEQEKLLEAVTYKARTGLKIPLLTTMDPEMTRPPAFWDRLNPDRFHYRR